MHSSAGPHTCGAATKFQRAACARSWGAPRTHSGRLPALPCSTSPRPARSSRSWAEGGKETGEELPWAAAPPLPLPPPRPQPPPHSPRPPSPRALSPPRLPTPEPRLPPRPQPLSPQTFRQDGGPRAGLPFPHVTAFQALSANGK